MTLVMFCDNYGNEIPRTGSLQVGALVAPARTAGTTQRARHVSRRVCVCVCVRYLLHDSASEGSIFLAISA